MIGHRPMGMEDYKGILRRRIWIIVIPAMVVPVLAYCVSLFLPNRYTSQTLVLVENQRVPEHYVKPVVTEDLTYRLSTMKEQILSRSRLQPILERWHLYGAVANDPTVDLKLDQMRKNVKVKAVISEIVKLQDPRAGVPGFTISFTYSDARTAQQVCAEITSMFIEANLKERQQSAQGTTDFLEKQLAESKKQLDEQDAKLATFKSKYLGQLPDQSQTNMGILLGMKSQLDAVTQALARAQQDKTYTESMLAQQVAAWESSQKDDNTASPTTLQQQLTALQTQLVSLQARYTDDYPDVIKTKNDIAQVKKQLDAAETVSSDIKTPKDRKLSVLEPTQIQQLRATVRQLDQTIKEKSHEEDRLQQQIRTYEGRIELTPKVEEEYKLLTRDYTTALNFYNDLLAKKSQSEMATNLELQQEGEQFRVMDPPNLPERPSFPNRPIIALGGFGGGIGLGLVITVVLEMMDRSLRTEADVTSLLRIPAIAVIPELGAPRDVETPPRQRRIRLTFWKSRELAQGARTDTVPV
jgi:polysaccharide chain length determinant protein (PEP-CTERM system associated)